jgi:AraC family transcriptional regulator, transcriptional activator FtrA
MAPRRRSASSQHTVAVVVFERTSVFELAVPCEVFGLDRSDMGMPTYDFMVCGVHAGPLTTKGGLFTIQTPYTLDDLDRADTVIVPAWDVHVSTPPELCDALRRAHARGARIASLCSGVFAVAAAGLLEGRRATTHWMWADVDPSVLYIDEGDVLTSAGTAAAIDLCLYMVRQDHGAEVANVFARRMIVPPHREGGQAQYVDTPVPPCDCDDLAATLDWAVHHLDEELTVEQLAARARMSPRTFARRFRASAGTTPLQWLLQQRVLAARRILETTDLSVDQVADRCGFGAAATLRMHFRRITGTTPQAYRATFRAA